MSKTRLLELCEEIRARKAALAPKPTLVEKVAERSVALSPTTIEQMKLESLGYNSPRAYGWDDLTPHSEGERRAWCRSRSSLLEKIRSILLVRSPEQQAAANAAWGNPLRK